MYMGKLETKVFKRTDIEYLYIETSHNGYRMDELARFAPSLINQAREALCSLQENEPNLDVTLWAHCKDGFEDMI